VAKGVVNMHPVIGIRREDKNEWERRVPLAPRHVRDLVHHGIEVYIQPSRIRTFTDEDYIEAGAKVQEDLSECNVVFGIKEFPAEFFEEGQTYLFFSHTIKGQKHNMPMLKELMDEECTLLDYEKITNDKNQRLIFFGNYAGLAGMLETLFTFGRRLEWEGMKTPFLGLKRPLFYGSLDEAKAALEVVATWIETEGLPEQLGPLVIGFAGYGNVSKGAQEILDILPVEEIEPEDLAMFMNNGEYSRHVIYKVVFYERDMAVTKDSSHKFELQDYFKHPEKYEGVFSQYLEHLNILVNCIYWTPAYPMLVTKEWVKNNWSMKSRLKVIGDITCDIEGSIQCTVEATDPGLPSYVYLADKDDIVYGWEGEGPVIMAVDTLPAMLPKDSSIFFGNQLMPFVAAIAKADYKEEFAMLKLPFEIKKCIIVHKGKLTPDYKYIAEHL
jgi:saccharopine dehydrogenase (NAD+, L-lysine-forming)